MEESKPTPEPVRKGIALAEAAHVLGVSEKTVRRRIQAGEIEGEKVPVDGGGLAWCVYLESNATDNAPDIALPAMDNVPEGTEQRAGTQNERAGTQNERAGSAMDNNEGVPEHVMDTLDTQRTNALDSSDTRAGTEVDNVPDTQTSSSEARVIEILERENQFLRNAVEQHQRSEAELRASIRALIAAQPKALTEGTSQVLAEPNVAPEPAQIPMQNDATDKEAGDVQSALNSGSNSPARRTFRKWLLEILRG